MSTIRESDIPDVIDLLHRFAALDRNSIRKTMTEDEIDLVYRSRMESIRTSLLNKGITIKGNAALTDVSAVG
jgi:hypothetical protein